MGIIAFFFLKSNINEFVKSYGDKVRLKNLFVDGYLGGTGYILLCILITLVLLILTIVFAYISNGFLSSGIQIIIAIIFIIWTLCLGGIPFFGTLLMLIVITIVLMVAFND